MSTNSEFEVKSFIVGQGSIALGEFIGLNFTTDFMLNGDGQLLGVAFSVSGPAATAILAAAEAFATAGLALKADKNNASFTGTSTWTGTRYQIFAVPGELQTAAAGTTLIASFAIPDETSVQFDFIGGLKGQTGVAKGGAFKGSACYQRTAGGAPVLVGAIVYQAPQVTTAGDNMTFLIVGNTLQVMAVAFDASHENWSCELRAAVTLATP